jgi:hypothetical protein
LPKAVAEKVPYYNFLFNAGVVSSEVARGVIDFKNNLTATPKRISEPIKTNSQPVWCEKACLIGLKDPIYPTDDAFLHPGSGGVNFRFQSKKKPEAGLKILKKANI